MSEQVTVDQDSDIKALIRPDLEIILDENEAMGFGRLDARSVHEAKDFIRRFGFEDLELILLRLFADVGVRW